MSTATATPAVRTGSPGLGTTSGPVLFVGGSGTVGRPALRWFRDRHADVPVLVAGRDLDTAQAVADALGGAEAVTVDLGQDRLALPQRVTPGAVVMLAPDDALTGLGLAQDLGVPYLNIGNGLVEVGPELAAVAHRPTAAPVVLASHWMGGAALMLTLTSSSALTEVSSIRIGAVLDEEDAAGPLALEDMTRLQQEVPAALVFQQGRRTWLSGEAARGEVTAVDGRVLEAVAYSPLDIISLHAATGAPDIRLDLVSGVSSGRRRGATGPAAEIVVQVEGRSHDGRVRRLRSSLELGAGQASLTGLSLVLSLGAVLGLEHRPAATPGLYLPELLSEPRWFTDQLAASGAVVREEER